MNGAIRVWAWFTSSNGMMLSRNLSGEAGDNDGGYSGDYLAAESYRYAVTKDPQARREATNTFQALRWLRTMTGIPGFPARAVWAKGERGHKSERTSGDYPAQWHDTADGKFQWKGDTSSDELCSHFYSVSIFLELAAQGEEIAQAKEHLASMASHLIDHGWELVDVYGKPTRWGRWDPAYFATDEGRYDRGLQSLELLSFIKAAATVSAEPKFATAYKQLVDLGYPAYTVRERQTFPPENVLHFLDELSFWSYWNLLRDEDDPRLHALYRRSLERTWGNPSRRAKSLVQLCLWRPNRPGLRNRPRGGAPAGLAARLDSLVIPKFSASRPSDAIGLHGLQSRHPSIFTARDRADALGSLGHAGRRWNRWP